MIEERARFEVILESLQSDFRVFGDKVVALSESHERTNARLDRLEANNDARQMRFDVFSRETKEQLGRLETKVDKLETKVDKLEGFAVDAQGRFEQLEGFAVDAQRRFEKLEGFAVDAQGRLKRIETHLELSGTSSQPDARPAVRRNRGARSRGRA